MCAALLPFRKLNLNVAQLGNHRGAAVELPACIHDARIEIIQVLPDLVLGIQGVQRCFELRILLAQHQRRWPYTADLFPFHQALDPPIGVGVCSKAGDGFACVGEIVEVTAGECCIEGTIGNLPHFLIGGVMRDCGFLVPGFGEITACGFGVLINRQGVRRGFVGHAIACRMQRSITILSGASMRHVPAQPFSASPQLYRARYFLGNACAPAEAVFVLFKRPSPGRKVTLSSMSQQQTESTNTNPVEGDAVGKRILVTGANAGIGFWTSLQLAQRGAEVILACRNPRKADAALSAISARVPHAKVSTTILDVASLASVADAVERLSALEGLDVLIANAGVVHAPGKRKQSVDGLELVAATNFFGHFALVAGLLPVLERTAAARVITLGSLATLLVKPRVDDLQLTKNYSSWQAYAQSKIMSQSFGFELDRRLLVAGSPVRALSAHPGYSISGRTPQVAGVNEPSARKRFIDGLQTPFVQGKNHGAWPIVRAALDTQAFSGSGPVFFGPRGVVKGAPAKMKPARITTDPLLAKTIWHEAERATGIVLVP